MRVRELSVARVRNCPSLVSVQCLCRDFKSLGILLFDPKSFFVGLREFLLRDIVQPLFFVHTDCSPSGKITTVSFLLFCFFLHRRKQIEIFNNLYSLLTHAVTNQVKLQPFLFFPFLFFMSEEEDLRQRKRVLKTRCTTPP